MLRITITETPSEQKWVLQGRLTESCAALLRLNWKKTRSARQGRHCLVDLKDVTFIDGSGQKVLRTMMKEGAQFLASGVCIKHVLETLKDRFKRGLTQPGPESGRDVGPKETLECE